MKYKSTRDNSDLLTFSEALSAGLAPDGGLFVPEQFHTFDIKHLTSPTLIEVGEQIIKTYAPDVTPELKSALNFPVPLEPLDSTTSILELYHGPTAAFKDVGARFLAECFSRIKNKDGHTVIVATSGDTGGAVAGAFSEKPGFSVAILFPKGMVSEFQEKQLTSWGGNVRAFKVRGTFDDCQKIVKEAFLDQTWKKKNLISANSINIGRILPQTIYYAWASLSNFHKTGKAPGFIVPTGNLGNAVASLWAKKMGFPVGKVILACNANKTISDYFKTGIFKPQPTISTLANAMDVGNPSNMERLLNLYSHFDDLKKEVEAFSIDDEDIKSTIVEIHKKFKRIVCPHTATALAVMQKIKSDNWIVVSTAHPAKFRNVVEPLVGVTIETPEALKPFEKRTGHFEEIDPNLKSLTEFYEN